MSPQLPSAGAGIWWNMASLLLGLASWVLPLASLAGRGNRGGNSRCPLSLLCCCAALGCQLFSVSSLAAAGEWAALEDTAGATAWLGLLLLAGTVLLNAAAALWSRGGRWGESTFGRRRGVRVEVVYYLPLVFFAVFFGVLTLRLGRIHWPVLLWLALFGLSGCLLGRGRAWGALPGLIPAADWIFRGLENWKTNLELWLGVGAAVFYLTCGIRLALRHRKNRWQ